MSHRRNTARSAFSLVEAIMSVAIVAIVAGVAVPRIAQSGSQRRADLAATKFRADLEQMQRGARAQGATRVLSQQANPTQYVYQDAYGTVHTIDLSAEPYGVDKITFTLDDASTTLTATPRGMLASGGTVRFQSGTSYTDVTLTGVRTASLADPTGTLGFTTLPPVADTGGTVGTASASARSSGASADPDSDPAPEADPSGDRWWSKWW